MKPEEEELRRLEKELKRVKLENEILKKAIGYFTKVRSEVYVHKRAEKTIWTELVMSGIKCKRIRLPKMAKK
ncbi:MAG: hypothetical protein KGZ85_08910 [Ignavibacterium sp.]|nr:hypothetical protein [Ignavibacterium sp.]